MKRLLIILFLAAGTAYGQIDNPPSSVDIVDATTIGRGLITAPNASAGRGVLGGSSFGGAIFTGSSATNRPVLIASILGFSTTNNLGFHSSLTNLWVATNPAAAVTALGATTVGNSVFTATNAAAAATAIGLGTTDFPAFTGLEILGDELQINGASINSVAFGGKLDFEERRFSDGASTVFAYSTNSFTVTPPATFDTNVTVTGNLAVSNNATFADDVAIAGALTVASLATTVPVTYALDAAEIGTDTNGVLALPDTANILRITNDTTISAVSNGRLGAFYFLVNQTTNNLIISNSATITARGATNLTLGASESATLITTTATNASAH